MIIIVGLCLVSPPPKIAMRGNTSLLESRADEQYVCLPQTLSAGGWQLRFSTSFSGCGPPPLRALATPCLPIEHQSALDSGDSAPAHCVKLEWICGAVICV